MSHEFPAATRAASPTFGVVLLVALTVLAGAVVGAGAGALGQAAVVDPSSQASLTMTVEGDRISFVHRGGDRLDVRELRLVVRVDDDELRHQPPVPYFSARGFRPGPTGPFNVAADPYWTAGEVASIRLAGTNGPALRPGATVTVAVFEEERTILELSATVRE